VFERLGGEFDRESPPMLATIAIVLIVLWLLGLLVFKVTGALIHIALIIGVVLLVLHFIRGPRSV
jgi:amino acid permease